MFDYATGEESAVTTGDGDIPAASTNDPQNGLTQGDTAGSISASQRTQVRLSERFKQAVYEKFDHRCPLTGIDHAELLTILHILGRAENHELAEDLANVVLLDWWPPR